MLVQLLCLVHMAIMYPAQSPDHSSSTEGMISVYQFHLLLLLLIPLLLLLLLPLEWLPGRYAGSSRREKKLSLNERNARYDR